MKVHRKISDSEAQYLLRLVTQTEYRGALERVDIDVNVTMQHMIAAIYWK